MHRAARSRAAALTQAPWGLPAARGGGRGEEGEERGACALRGAGANGPRGSKRLRGARRRADTRTDVLRGVSRRPRVRFPYLRSRAQPLIEEIGTAFQESPRQAASCSGHGSLPAVGQRRRGSARAPPVTPGRPRAARSSCSAGFLSRNSRSCFYFMSRYRAFFL